VPIVASASACAKGAGDAGDALASSSRPTRSTTRIGRSPMTWNAIAYGASTGAAADGASRGGGSGVPSPRRSAVHSVIASSGGGLKSRTAAPVVGSRRGSCGPSRWRVGVSLRMRVCQSKRRSLTRRPTVCVAAGCTRASSRAAPPPGSPSRSSVAPPAGGRAERSAAGRRSSAVAPSFSTASASALSASATARSCAYSTRFAVSTTHARVMPLAAGVILRPRASAGCRCIAAAIRTSPARFSVRCLRFCPETAEPTTAVGVSSTRSAEWVCSARRSTAPGTLLARALIAHEARLHRIAWCASGPGATVAPSTTKACTHAPSASMRRKPTARYEPVAAGAAGAPVAAPARTNGSCSSA